VDIGIDVGDQTPWQRMITAAIVGSVDQAADVIDAELVEDDD
jgi:hypothetical protein